jgi:hypothetical protein
MEEGLSNLYIMSVLKDCRLQHFKGVFSCNNIPDEIAMLRHFSIICNLEKEGELGSHFITIVATPVCLLYIDSLGMSCANSHLNQFMTLTKRRVHSLDLAMQHPTSPFCGFYAILMVLFYDLKNPPTTVQFHRHDLLTNDQQCISYVQQLIKYHINKKRK